MPRSVPIELLSFRRTFALLMVLVAVPSAGLTGLGVVAILNERAAVEKRLASVWQDRLETLSTRLRQALEASSVERVDGAVRVTAPSGLRLSGAAFRLSHDVLDSADTDLVAALSPVRSQLAFLPERPSFLSLPGPTGPVLIVALRTPDGILGSELSPEGLERLLAESGQDLRSRGEQVRFELTPVQPARPGLVGKFIGGVPGARNALEVTPLAERPLPAPLQEFQLRAMPEAGDPVAFASLRNRLVYAGLLGAFYATLVVGVVYTARALYLQARLSRLKTDFVSLVSHELRTPLTSIRMFIETLALGRVKDPAQTQEVLELLQRETERLSTLIERVLDWARLESGRQRYRKERLTPQQIIDASLEAFRAQRLDSKIELRCDMPAPLPAVEGDREALAGALLNLLHNAYKYSGGEKRIELRAGLRNGGVDIEVEDHGVGIAKRDRKRVFDRFYRVDNLLTRQTEGSGLGLSISRRIIEAHGGKLTLKSELGKGSTFTIHLPAAKEAEA